MADSSITRDSLLDTALELAERTGWEKFRLYLLAGHLDISLDDVRRHFAQKDDLVEAWFDRADSAMLKAADSPAVRQLDIRDRLYHLLLAWLDSLAVHKKVTRDMLLYKLEPAHIHLQIQGILRVSRTVQWLREAARMENTHLLRILEETALTSLYLTTFLYWLGDQSPSQQATRAFLAARLEEAERIARSLQPGSPEPAPQDTESPESEG